MQRKLFLTIPVLTLILFASTTAYGAEGGGGGNWWEGMSGPGPWKGVFGFYSFCFEPQDFGEHDHECSIDERKMWLNLGGSYMWADEEEGDETEVQSPSLRAYSFEPSVDFRIHKLLGYAPIFLGMGAGIHYFNGEDVGLWRASIEPRVSIVFPRIIREELYIQIRYTAKYFYTGFSSADFGDPTGTFDTDGGETIQTLAVIFGIDF